MLPTIDQLPPDHRSGFIAVIGRPNVGKSTLFNRILGQKIAITSPKPQTTRDQINGIYTTDDEQIIFVDTPGIHVPKHKLGEYMVEAARETIVDADVLLWLVDINEPPTEEDRRIARMLGALNDRRPLPPLALGLNKSDRWGGEAVGTQRRVQQYLDLIDWVGEEQRGRGAGEQGSKEEFEDSDLSRSPAPPLPIPFSAITGDNVNVLLAALRERLPVGPRYYPEEQVTDLQVRFIVAELIRERALHYLSEEVPHSVAVVVDEFTRRSDTLRYILANIYVERESQKEIVIGSKGSMIKRIGQAARPEIEEMVGMQVYLELRVKVWEKWRKRASQLRRLGYATGE